MTRLSYGFVAGGLASLLKNALDLFVYYGIGFQHHRYIEHASGILLGRPTENLAEALYFLFVDIWFSGFIGILFLYINPYFKNDNYLFKGWLFGSMLWFLIHSLGSVLQIPTFHKMMFATLILHFVTDSIYGLALAYLAKRWEQRARYTP